ncbi:MAG: hypothetical protein ACFFHD_08010 [Promethearchaeota archaeon]
MINIKHSRKLKYLSIFTSIIIIFTICLSGLLKNSNDKSNFLFYQNSSITEDININNYSKEDYSAIISEETYSLGNITITDLLVNSLELGFCTYNDIYPLLTEDYNSTAINMTIEDFKFIKTVTPAKNDNLNVTNSNKNNITVMFNETLYFKYNNSKTEYLIYHSRLANYRFIEFYIQNGTKIIKLEEETDFYFDDHEFIVFYYKDFLQKESTFNFTGSIFNFSMHLIWEWDILIQEWDFFQTNDLSVKNALDNYSVDFSYSFHLTGKKYNQSVLDPLINVDNMFSALRIDLFDRNLLYNYTLELNNETVNFNTHLNSNKTIKVLLSDSFSSNYDHFRLNFSTIFTLQFENAVGKLWAIDRLVAKRNIHERIYFISIVAGPKYFTLKSISFYEPSILFENMISAFSLFEREIDFYYLNTSTPGETRLIVNAPYLIRGETCPFTLKYETSTTLNIIVTDIIHMPLIGAEVKLYYHNKEYGTFISSNRVQPISLGKTNDNGEIILNDVIIGNYTVRVYYRNSFIKEDSVNTYKENNFVRTNIPHFPLWIVVFGLLNGIILIIGFVFYLKSKKLR